MLGRKYDTGKPRPTLIPAEVYRAVLTTPFVPRAMGPLEDIPLAMLEADWLSALDGVQDLLCPAPHPDSRLHGIDQIVGVLEFGASKYGANNWQGVEPNRYVEAAWRHFFAYCNGQGTDTESGLPHLAHLGACLVFLVWFDVCH